MMEELCSKLREGGCLCLISPAKLGGEAIRLSNDHAGLRNGRSRALAGGTAEGGRTVVNEGVLSMKWSAVLATHAFLPLQSRGLETTPRMRPGEPNTRRT